jgi:alpha-ribazole phosphatase
MKIITFVRHAQSIANAGGVTMENDAIPLSELGKVQSQALASILECKASKIFVSEYSRTHETARPFCEKMAMEPYIHPLLHEFSTIDPALLVGMTGEQRRPIADAYWQEAVPTKRMGENAETFNEFEQRVEIFRSELKEIPDGAVLFGHGMWLGMLIWKLLGFSATDSLGMKSFRRFQTGLPMPNCAVYTFMHHSDGHWHIQANEKIMRYISTV